MNALLIYPEFPDTFWSFKHALKFVHKKALSPPLGLLTVAALLPQDWVKRLVDVNVGPLKESDLAWADYALISAMTVQRDSTNKIIERCQRANLKVIAGGPLFTVQPDDYPMVDHLVLNEAELTLPVFLKDLERGQPARVYQNSEFADIKQTPIPLWELANKHSYASMNIQYSRGCPYNCEFCNVTTLFGHRPRTKTAEQIIAELDSLYQQGWREGVFFVDDNLIGNKRNLKNELLPALIEWKRDKPSINFSTEVSINLSDDDQLIKLMVEAGFKTVFIGIETPNTSSLVECNKKQNLNRDMLGDVKRLQHAGIQVQGGFIVGFDNDTPAIFESLIDFIQRSGIVTAMVGILQAPPGTILYEKLKQAGRLLKNMSGDNVDGTTNIIPKMGADVLKDGYKKLLHQIYSPELYYQRVKTFLQEYQPPKASIQTSSKLSPAYIGAFFRSVMRLGIIGKERKQYWKLLFWTLFNRPRLVPLAVVFAVYGHHFRRICEIHVT